MNEYLDKLEAELRASGVGNTPSNVDNTLDNQVDKDLKIVLKMQELLNIKYSDEQKDILLHRGNSVILACAGSGKALVNGTGVLTPYGYKPIESLNVGDIVYDHTGNEQTVLGVYPQGKKQVYNVITDLGDVIECCSEHLWTVKFSDSEHWEVADTQHICDKLHSVDKASLPDMINYMKCSKSFYELVRKSIVQYDKLGDMIETLEPDNKKLRTLYESCMTPNDSIKSMYSLCMAWAYSVSNNDDIKSVLKEACEYLGLTNSYIKSVQVTGEYKEMTCIRVSGSASLFLTEHCIPTHNTTMTTHLIAKRIMSGEIKDPSKLVYVTYSAAGADEMKVRMQKVMKQLGYKYNIDVRTLHSFFYKLIREFGLNNKKVLGESRKYAIIAEACKEAGFSYKDDDITKLIGLMGYQVNNLLNDTQTFDCVYNDIENLTLEQYTDIRHGYAQKKNSLNLIDFEDMQMYMHAWTVRWKNSDNESYRKFNRQVLDYCKTMFTDYYVDEAQDVGKIQFEILNALISEYDNTNKLAANFTFIGDDDQAIYSWRGSDPTIIGNAGPYFNIKNMVLSTNYRCKSEIVDFATTGVKCNNTRYEKGMNAYQAGGSVKIRMVYDSENNLYEMSKLAKQQIASWIDEGCSPNDIAVLCRNNKHLSVLSILLLNDGIFYTGADSMRATTGIDYYDAKMLIELCEPCYKHEVINKLFWKFNRYVGNRAISLIAKFMNESGLSIEDTLWYICKYHLDKELIEEKTLRVSFEASEKLRYALDLVSKSNKEIFYTLYMAITEKEKVDRLKTLVFMYKDGMSQLGVPSEAARNMRTLLSLIVDIADKEGFDEMKESLRVTEQFESGSMGVMGEKVTLSTIHSAKGREWKNIIMFASDNISEPSFSRIVSLKNSERTTDGDISNYIDEERRLFYVGCTRAKENLVLLTSPNPSVFVLDSLGLQVKNQDIIKYAMNKGYYTEFNSEIKDLIIDSKSKYSTNK